MGERREKSRYRLLCAVRRVECWKGEDDGSLSSSANKISGKRLRPGELGLSYCDCVSGCGSVYLCVCVCMLVCVCH